MTALLVSLGPDLYWWIGSLLTDGFGGESFGWTGYGICPGFELYLANAYTMYTILDTPLFWYGGAPLLLLGFAGWYLSVRRGRDRLGRTIAGFTATLLIARCLPGPLMYAYDATSPDCAQFWDPLSFALKIDLYYLIPPILILLATRTPRRAYAQRGPVGRRVAIVLTLLGTSVITAQSTAPSKVGTSWELDCDGSGHTPQRGLTTAEAQFLCPAGAHGQGPRLLPRPRPPARPRPRHPGHRPPRRRGATAHHGVPRRTDRADHLQVTSGLAVGVQAVRPQQIPGPAPLQADLAGTVRLGYLPASCAPRFSSFSPWP
ncbi:hypothetical protein GCM10009555_103230 [Acrocarpospora macrocephala]|uniref:Uncharacterized protein n=1 Tax=Acrocarpospora macrocephala TaxID=150177 RepID=A0A5M3WDV3_9ACTN|nr:hypothetical protein [Acrocarpospora macrocephala]GES07247.1 hypothetical protein Amac_008420 [Acrocarpospora macrocephala]